MQTKTFPARIKLRSKDDDGEPEASAAGQFEALVSVFGNRDSYGEVVMPGAFSKTLAAWAEKGDPIPVYWSHRLDDPDYNIGHVLEASETEEGLLVKAQLDMENPKAVTTHNLLRSRRVTDFSFSFNVPPGGAKESEAGDSLELHEIDLYEVGPTPIGANPATELLAVKSGRVLSAKNVETIKAARDALKGADNALAELLKLSTTTGDDDEKSRRVTRLAKTEEPARAKVEELVVVPSIESVLAHIELSAL